MNRIHAIVTASVVAWLALCLPAPAQVAGGAISGTITNVAGAQVPAASVTVTNAATGLARSAVSDKDGFYNVPNLNPGNYAITVTMEGLKTLKTSVLITVGSEALVNGRLQP